jgi:hypothetical protein
MNGPPDRRSGRRLTGPVLAAALCVLAVTGCGNAPRAAPSAAVVTAASPSPAAPLVLAESRPVRVQIPAIGVDSELMDLGVQDDGTLEVPPTGFPAGWFTGAPTPGELGPAVIAGHVDWAGSPGVFARLHDLVAGDEVSVAREDGSTAVFRVSQVGQFAKDAFPTAAVYGDLDHAGLRLITCGGAFDAGARSYLDNTGVFADLVGRPAA